MEIFKSDALNRKFRSHFRLVEPDDAGFIYDLRANPVLNRHLNDSPSDVGSQREWIEHYKEREALGGEFYFVIVSDKKDVGVVRMYEFDNSVRSFCWGSWIIRPPRPFGLAAFSAAMIYEIGFDILGFAQSRFDVRKGNTNVIAFHARSGARAVREDDRNVYFNFTRDDYKKFIQGNKRRIEYHRTMVD